MERLKYLEHNGILILQEDHRNIVQTEQQALFEKSQKAISSEESSRRVLVDLTGVRFSPLLLEATSRHLLALKDLGASVAVLGSMGFDNIFYTATSLNQKDFPYFISHEEAVAFLVK